jgi:hypothetical protein
VQANELGQTRQAFFTQTRPIRKRESFEVVTSSMQTVVTEKPKANNFMEGFCDEPIQLDDEDVNQDSEMLDI